MDLARATAGGGIIPVERRCRLVEDEESLGEEELELAGDNKRTSVFVSAVMAASRPLPRGEGIVGGTRRKRNGRWMQKLGMGKEVAKGRSEFGEDSNGGKPATIEGSSIAAFHSDNSDGCDPRGVGQRQHSTAQVKFGGAVATLLYIAVEICERKDREMRGVRG
ncbi:hypothetical protein [Oryza sativa Japonica Group]|uniref:Uncharacterized protein n=1 Tax=Oryza sativa subsp. japonica TaxID=39947 RepID=Q5Z837_ORYSJ|nr:hypothetical protein [Oryza sativa Japonica Group]BAD54024.1 hypothetical protein [Oryza sativa Japonica Group]